MQEWVAQIHRDHLISEGIDAVILNKRDSSYTLNLGKGGYVFVMVRKDDLDRAVEILTDLPDAEDLEIDSTMDDELPDSEHQAQNDDLA